MTTLRDVAELVRLPAALSVPGDVLAGATAAGVPLGRRTALLPLSSVLLYWAGMALNDYADRDLDAVERPERPIPSGRVAPRGALGLAVGLTTAGLAVAGAAGRRSLAVAVPLAGTVWAYDLAAKRGAAGPLVMGTARGLDVLLGAAGHRAAAPAALAVAAHTTAVTALSRGEVHGAEPRTAHGALATTITTAVVVAAHGLRRAPAGRAGRAASPRAAGVAAGTAVALAAVYATAVGREQRRAATRPDGPTVRRATGAGIRGLVPLQAALTAGAGAPVAAAALMAAGPLLRVGARVVSPT
jgi:4-hydroxybenzoate polyprenyltransferase